MATSAIPTFYNSVQFRSRIEARWASFFDELGWRWEYEPVDLDGYIPDFTLRFCKPLLVEVKADMELSDLQQYTKRIEHSGWRGSAMIVGGSLFDAEPGTTIGLLGIYLGRGGDGSSVLSWEPARLVEQDDEIGVEYIGHGYDASISIPQWSDGDWRATESSGNLPSI